jgi:16S rRNA (guanine527-N7)-methyltransferase
MNHIAGAAEFVRTFGVSRETVDRLQVYADLLGAWQKSINLVAPSTVADVWHRHFADSAQLVTLAPQGPLTWVDLGSGAGFPGLVVAILLAERGDCRVVLVESDGRKCAFLREVARKTDIRGRIAVDIVTERIETAANTIRVGGVDVVSARALAPLERLLGLCHPFFGPSTVALLPKGRELEAELAVARQCWHFVETRTPSLTANESWVLGVRSLRPV